MRGSSPAVAKSIESFNKVLDAASAVIVDDDYNSDYREGLCKGYEYIKNAHKDYDTWCFGAYQDCCSSVKKYDQWESFCDFYGFEEPDETSEGITGHAPWTVTLDGVNCKYCDGYQC